VAKFLGIYSSRRFYSDWTMAVPIEKGRMSATWLDFKQAMHNYYKPTENLTLKNFRFRSLSQGKEEAFIAFCNRVEKEAKHCQFLCDSQECTAEATAVRDQIVFGMLSEDIREEALKNSWNLTKLRNEGMRLESAAKSAIEISGEARINRVARKYSRKNPKKNKGVSPESESKNTVACFLCGLSGVKRFL